MYSGYEFQTKQNDVNQRPSRDSTTTVTGPSRGIRLFRRDRQSRKEEGEEKGGEKAGRSTE